MLQKETFDILRSILCVNNIDSLPLELVISNYLFKCDYIVYYLSYLIFKHQRNEGYLSQKTVGLTWVSLIRVGVTNIWWKLRTLYAPIFSTKDEVASAEKQETFEMSQVWEKEEEDEVKSG